MRRTWLVLGILIILLGLFIFFAQAFIFDLVFPQIERSLNPTTQLTPEAERLFYLVLYILTISFIVIGSLVAGLSKATVRHALKQTFLTDEMCQPNSSLHKPVTILILSSLIGVIITTLYTFRGSFNLEYLFQEDGLLESLTAINFLAASLLIASTVWSIRKMVGKEHVKNFKVLIITLILIIVIFFVIGMEEISWGQRIIGWETPATLNRINYSGETNIHNIFSPLFSNLYRFLGLFFLFSLIAGWLFVHRWPPSFYYIIVPHPSLIVLAFLISISGLIDTGVQAGELFEELFSIFCLFYAIRVYLCFRSEEQIALILTG